MVGTKNLFISALLQKAFIFVNEAGSEAAAAWAVVVQFRSMPCRHRRSPRRRTGRKLEVQKLLADGCSNQDIADRLVVSLATAKKHTSSILSKLDAVNRTQAIARARQIGLL